MTASGGGNRRETEVLSLTEGLDRAVELLRTGELVALPTETVYGLGGSALDPLACAKIFEAKSRPLSDPLIVHLPDREALSDLAVASPRALALAEAFWPGPLTLILPRRPQIPDMVTAGQDTVAVRLSAHPDFQQVVTAFGGPIAAPSANRFGRISPTSAGHVLAELGGRIPLIIDGGNCQHGIESTIVRVWDDGLEVLRHGPVTREELSAFGPIRSGDSDLVAPGGMKSHYAPRTPLEILRPGTSKDQDRSRAGLLAWTGTGEGYRQVENLSRTQNLREAAANLFGAMRRLDEAGLERIFAEELPEHDLGAAIMERLRKAAA